MQKRTWKITSGLIFAIVVLAIFVAVVRPKWLRAGADLPGLYEQAEGTTDGSIGVGFVTVRLAAVARNNRDGSIQITDGKDQTTEWDSANINSASSWLDRAAVRLETEGGELEILEARIFDHTTRELLALKYDDTSVFPRGTEVIEFSRVGDLLPKTIDVWIRAWIRRIGGLSYRINAEPGATTSIGEGTLITADIASGWVGWNSKTGFVNPDPKILPNVPGISVEFRWSGDMPEGRFRIVAVDRDGKTRYHDDFFTDFGNGRVQLLHYPVSPENLGHFELESIGKRVTFFFEAVKLPDAGDAFQPVPTLKLDIGGKDVAETVAEFDAARINTLSFRKQMCETGASQQNGHAFISLRPCESEHERRGCSVLVQSQGVNLNAWDLELLGNNGEKLEWGNRSTFRAGGLAICHGIDLSLDKVDSIVLSRRKE